MLSSLTGVENIIVFVIDTYQAFYLCVFQLLIRAGLAGAITVKLLSFVRPCPI